MNSKRICYTRPDGGVSVVVPAPGFVARFDTEAEALAECLSKDVPPEAFDVVECDAAEIPADRTFRDAWIRDTGPVPVVVDMAKARAIHMNLIRVPRDAALGALDVDYLRALEAGDNALAATIATRKQALRDIPQTFDLMTATTPAALQALWPPELAGTGAR